jgi:hypothetical protein
MPHAQKKDEKTMLTREERRARRELRREKQRKDNIVLLSQKVARFEFENQLFEKIQGLAGRC